MGGVVRTPNERAKALFAPIGSSYDRCATVLSLGQDPRWRRFLVSRVDVEPGASVLDVATGTAAVAIELARRKGARVVGIDQSPEMLAVGQERVARAGLRSRIELVEGNAERLPFEDGSFDALTVTYLLRYVGDPAATARELARVVRPDGMIASLEFGVPPRPLPRVAWEAYMRIGLPTAGRLVSPAWGEVGRFLGPSIRGFYGEGGLERVLGWWQDAGVGGIRYRLLSLGGGVVIWGKRR